MKKFGIIAAVAGIAILLLSLAGCSQTAGIGEEFSLSIGQSIEIDGKDLKITFTEVSGDSRCPTGVVCIWAGKVDVKIKVESPVPGTITLSTYDNPVDTVGNYSFKITDVSPYPISTKTIKLEDYVVLLKIEKLIN